MKRIVIMIMLVMLLAACLPPVEPTADPTPTREVGYGQN